MKRFFVVLFVLCSISLFAQADKPADLSFSGLADFVRYFNPEAETSFGMDLTGSSTIEIASASLIQINGCVRPRWQDVCKWLMNI